MTPVCERTPLMKVESPDGQDRILLHCCCAPCSSAIVECLVASGLHPLIFFSNSNIVPLQEYELRRAEICRYAAEYGLDVVDDDYDHAAWLDCVLEKRDGDEGRSRELALMPERRDRCLNCFGYRLERAANYAAEHGYTILTTTLASSRWKDLGQVNAAGEAACNAVNERSAAAAESLAAGNTVSWWGMNWRKGGLQPRRSEIIREKNFYNQTFCGCEFSHPEL